MDDKKHPTQPDGNQQSEKTNSQTAGETSKAVVSARPSRRIFAKRWLYPAIYLGAAAIIIGLMYARSQMAAHSTLGPTGNSSGSPNPSGATNPITTPTASASQYQWPVAMGVKPVLTMGFYDATASAKQQATELVSFGNGYSPHLGYDIKVSNGQPFSVTAAVAGQVTKIGSSVLNGHVVEVLSNDGYLEKYESLGKVHVTEGETVQQGQVLGTSGTCQFEQSQGNHLYFEVDKSSTPVDPATVLPKL